MGILSHYSRHEEIASGGTVTFRDYDVHTGVSTDLATVPMTNGIAMDTTGSSPSGHTT
jgi:hypothetical protein